MTQRCSKHLDVPVRLIKDAPCLETQVHEVNRIKIALF